MFNILSLFFWCFCTFLCIYWFLGLCYYVTFFWFWIDIFLTTSGAISWLHILVCLVKVQPSFEISSLYSKMPQIPNSYPMVFLRSVVTFLIICCLFFYLFLYHHCGWKISIMNDLYFITMPLLLLISSVVGIFCT